MYFEAFKNIIESLEHPRNKQKVTKKSPYSLGNQITNKHMFVNCKVTIYSRQKAISFCFYLTGHGFKILTKTNFRIQYLIKDKLQNSPTDIKVKLLSSKVKCLGFFPPDDPRGITCLLYTSPSPRDS